MATSRPITKPTDIDILKDLKSAIKKTSGYGSVEIYVQDYKITQITTRSIKKTSHCLKSDL